MTTEVGREIFSATLKGPRATKEGKPLHFHNRPRRGTCADEVGAFKTARKALNECPDGWEVFPCFWDHEDVR